MAHGSVHAIGRAAVFGALLVLAIACEGRRSTVPPPRAAVADDAATDGGDGPPDAYATDVSAEDAFGEDASARDTSAEDARGPRPDGAMPRPDTGPGRDATVEADASVQPRECAPLAARGGPTVRVGPSRAEDLPSIVRAALEGTTILLEDGTYRIRADGESARRLHFAVPRVTLRSASDDASRVILDGEYRTAELITISASEVTIAHLTLVHAVDHLIHVSPASSGPDVLGVRLYGLRLIDGGEQFVKVNPNATRSAWVDSGLVECSSFVLTDQGRPRIERSSGGCYTGGVDAHGARGWAVRQNRFDSIYCAGEGLAEHAIHFWTGSRDTLVENNTIIGCARGIGFGLVESGERRRYGDDPGVGYLGHIGGIIRNNIIHADHPYFDTGIELDQAREARVYHNTIFAGARAAGFYSSIDYRFANTSAEIRNNLVQRITGRNGARAVADHNVESATADLFVDAAGLDFHLSMRAAPAIDRGAVVAEAGLDIDGQPHDFRSTPDIGADEWRP